MIGGGVGGGVDVGVCAVCAVGVIGGGGEGGGGGGGGGGGSVGNLALASAADASAAATAVTGDDGEQDGGGEGHSALEVLSDGAWSDEDEQPPTSRQVSIILCRTRT